MNSRNHYYARIKWSICAIGIVSCGVIAASPKPRELDNAALVYYQAFLLCPDANMDDIPREAFHAVFNQSDVPQAAREYVRECADAIELMRVASHVGPCDWGMDALLRASAELRLAQRSRYAAFLVCCNARILAADADYVAALNQCLVVRRMAKHLSQGTVVLLVEPLSIDGYALQCIQQILGVMPPEEQTLAYLREQIVSVPPVSNDLWLRLDQGFERYLWQLRMGGTVLPRLRGQLLEERRGATTSGKEPPLTDDDLLEMIRGPFVAFLDSIRDTLAKNIPYEKTYAAIERLANTLEEQAREDAARLLSLYLPPEKMPDLYNLQLAHQSHYNAIVAAIEVYRANAARGRLPEDLWEGLPGDPYSGKRFEYQRTPQGFVLRGRVKPTDQSKPWEYRFGLRE